MLRRPRSSETVDDTDLVFLVGSLPTCNGAPQILSQDSGGWTMIRQRFFNAAIFTTFAASLYLAFQRTTPVIG